MQSKYESSVVHAMATWQKALQPDRGADVKSTAMQRRELLNKVLSEQQDELNKANYKKSPSARPNHYEDYLARLRSYKSSTWFAKPGLISATQCARFGWVNVASNRLQCQCCQSVLAHSHLDTDGRELRQTLRSAHHSTCAWSEPGACSPISFLSPPRSECVESCLGGLAERMRGNWARLLPSSSASLAALSTLVWPRLGVSVPVCGVDGGSTAGQDVTFLLSGGHCGDGDGDAGACNASGQAAIIAEHVFELMSSARDGSISSTSSVPSGAERDALLRVIRASRNSPPGTEDQCPALFLRAYCLVVQASLLGLELRVDSTAAGAHAASGTLSAVVSLTASCPLCLISLTHKLSAPAPLVLARCHRSFCPHICGYAPIPCAEDQGNPAATFAVTAPTVPVHVPAGWLKALECLLSVTLGVETVESLLGKGNMSMCLSEKRKQGGKRRSSVSPVKVGVGSSAIPPCIDSSSPSPPGSSSRRSSGVSCRSAEGADDDDDEDDNSPFLKYRKIKHLLDS